MSQRCILCICGSRVLLPCSAGAPSAGYRPSASALGNYHRLRGRSAHSGPPQIEIQVYPARRTARDFQRWRDMLYVGRLLRHRRPTPSFCGTNCMDFSRRTADRGVLQCVHKSASPLECAKIGGKGRRNSPEFVSEYPLGPTLLLHDGSEWPTAIVWLMNGYSIVRGRDRLNKVE